MDGDPGWQGSSGEPSPAGVTPEALVELPLAIGDLLLAIDVLTDENAELALAINGYGTRIAELETTMGSMSVSGAEAIFPA